MIETVSISDHNYVMPTVVMICSVCENNRNVPITFHMIVDDSVDDDDKEKFFKLIKNYQDKTVSFHTVNIENLKQIPSSSMFPLATYYRMELAEILPSETHKVLFLDGDMIIRHSLLDLWETDVTQYAYAAVHDCTEGNISYYNRLHYSSKLGYFNSGVMLINLDYWRLNKTTSKLFDYIEKFPNRILYCDQDVFNRVLCGQIKSLPFKYNLQNGFLYSPEDMKIDYYGYENDLNLAIKDPVIVHFTAKKNKPWIEGSDHPYSQEFLEYRKKTAYGNTSLYRKKRKIKDLFEKIAIVLGLRFKEPSYINNTSNGTTSFSHK